MIAWLAVHSILASAVRSGLAARSTPEVITGKGYSSSCLELTLMTLMASGYGIPDSARSPVPDVWSAWRGRRISPDPGVDLVQAAARSRYVEQTC